MPKDFRSSPARWHNEPGTFTEERRYGVAPDGTLDDWAILCSVKGATGPFEEVREVTVGAWSAKDTLG